MQINAEFNLIYSSLNMYHIRYHFNLFVFDFGLLILAFCPLHKPLRLWGWGVRAEAPREKLWVKVRSKCPALLKWISRVSNKPTNQPTN